jgi:hypothetical protein
LNNYLSKNSQSTLPAISLERATLAFVHAAGFDTSAPNTGTFAGVLVKYYFAGAATFGHCVTPCVIYVLYFIYNESTKTGYICLGSNKQTGVTF